MFSSEEIIIKELDTILVNKDTDHKDLLKNYKRLGKNYKKMFKQFRRTVKMSDKQQHELKKSRETILSYNKELTNEIHERQRAEDALKNANLELQRLASLDGLTQLANRRRFDEYLNQQWRTMAREKKTIALIMCDIDYFKRYNDAYGHQGGDDCLIRVAQALHNSLNRSADLATRYGGEEFAIILPYTESKGAFQVAQSIKLSIKSLEIKHAQSMVNNIVTMSMGVADVFPTLKCYPEELISKADIALYEAKKQGRDRIVLASDTE